MEHWHTKEWNTERYNAIRKEIEDLKKKWRKSSGKNSPSAIELIQAIKPTKHRNKGANRSGKSWNGKTKRRK